MTEEQTAALKAELIDAGYQPDVAEALAEYEYGAVKASILSKREVMDIYLTWNGIHGYTDSILSAIANCEAKGKK